MLTTNSTLLKGATIKGKQHTYTIERDLGQGTFGITYLARYRAKVSGEMGSGYVTAQVCIKEFFMKDFNTRDEQTGSLNDTSGVTIVERYRKAFMREAKNLARMQHPGIVNVFEVIEANNTVYIVMEYIDGGSLDDYIHSKGRLSEVESLRCMLPICEALDYMHRQRMLHLDMKPKNVMRDTEGHLYLIDFGLSKQYDANGEPESSTSIGLGTPGYAPTEQAVQKIDDEHNFRATIDVYALGATLYKMLTGQTPPLATEVSDSIIEGEDLIQQNLTQIGVSKGLAQTVSKAMWPSSKKRVQSVAELLSRLTPAKPMSEETVIEAEEEETIIESQAEVTAAKEKAEAEARAKAEQERKAREEAAKKAEAERKAKAEAERQAREEAVRQKKTSSASQSSEPATKKPWLWGIAAVIALALVWLVWPKSQTDVPPVIEPELIASTADSIKEPAEPLANEPKVEPAKPVPSFNANGHDYVDLGLKDSKGRTIYWATCNVGASKPEDYGLYFAWGETKGYTGNTNDGRKFDWANYKWCNGSENTMTKYSTDSQYGTVDNKKTLSLSDDAAHVNWGGDWRMPTKTELGQLKTKCKWTWNSSKECFTVKGPNGNSILLPVAGCRENSNLIDAGSVGLYWSSSLHSSVDNCAWYLGFDPFSPEWYDNYRYAGLSVRAVCTSSE